MYHWVAAAAVIASETTMCDQDELGGGRWFAWLGPFSPFCYEIVGKKLRVRQGHLHTRFDRDRGC